MLERDFCGNECKPENSHTNNERTCHRNPDRLLPEKSETWKKSMEKKRGRTARNQFSKARELGLPVPIVSEETRLKLRKASIGRVWSEEERKRHSKRMKQAVIDNPDSYAKHNVVGRVKNVEYNGHILKGSWELIVAKWLDSMDISWMSEVNPKQYNWNGSEHLYFPDFYLPNEDVYIEVKGYMRERDLAKWSSFDGTLVIIDKTVINKLNEFDTIAQLVEQRAYTS